MNNYLKGRFATVAKGSGDMSPSQERKTAGGGCGQARLDRAHKEAPWLVGLQHRRVDSVVRQYYLVDARTEGDALDRARLNAQCFLGDRGVDGESVDEGWAEVRRLHSDGLGVWQLLP